MAQTVELHRDGGSVRQAGAGPDPLIGQHLLHYRVREVIGQGGMSVVYLGHDEHLHRDVAIKVLHPFLAEKAECRARLAREARAVARLEHPHILKVFDYSGEPKTIDETPEGARDRVRGFAEGFIVAELVRGLTLKHFAERHQLWNCPEVGALVVWQLGMALEHAHQSGVVHRDIKPENVMVRDDGWLKLMDFGIAHIADQKGLTVTGTLLGSPAHMAPEVIDGSHADERSDLFSLGTVLYWLTTGTLPFEAPTPHALLKQIVEGRSVPAQQKSARISDDLARFLARAMATRPADRFESAGVFCAALAEVLERSGLAASPEPLRNILADPEHALPRVQLDVRRAFLARASALLDEGAPVRALGCLNRVLADDAEDADAQALLARAQGGIDEAEPAADEAPSTATTGVALAGLAPHEVTEPTRRAPDSRRLAQQVGVIAAAAGLIVAAVVVATRFDDVRPMDAKPAPAVDPPAPLPAPVDEGTSTGAPAAFAGGALVTDDTGKVAKVDPARPKPPKKDDAAAIAKLDTPPAPAPAVVERMVTFRVAPWANITVDGKPFSAGKPVATGLLAVGPHVALLQNPSAKDKELPFEVKAEGEPPVITVKLEPRPALLKVTCNVADASVSVAGTGGVVSAGQTLERPLVVTLGELSRAVREVFVVKKGYRPKRQKVEFLAGETAVLDVVLEPDGSDEAAP
ncbi:MAG: serine/threonine protein kinase [Deltaproteobacteria bacterium]|nr:serine/threonine protein kinase [Deltaproteobacteria bacterium]